MSPARTAPQTWRRSACRYREPPVPIWQRGPGATNCCVEETSSTAMLSEEGRPGGHASPSDVPRCTSAPISESVGGSVELTQGVPSNRCRLRGRPAWRPLGRSRHAIAIRCRAVAENEWLELMRRAATWAVPVQLIDDMVEGAVASVPRIPLRKGRGRSHHEPRASSNLLGDNWRYRRYCRALPSRRALRRKLDDDPSRAPLE